MLPESTAALVVDPAKKLIYSHKHLQMIWPLLNSQQQKRFLGKLRQFKKVTLNDVIDCSSDIQQQTTELSQLQSLQNEHLKQRGVYNKLNDIKMEAFSIKSIGGRAPYSKELMHQIWQDVFERGIHPTEQGGALFRDDQIRKIQILRNLDRQTNNHLMRHRLKILERLHADMIKEFAQGDLSRILEITVNVNKDLRELSGKTKKEQDQVAGQQRANFYLVLSHLNETLKKSNIPITPGIIRKARIAEDLGWECPYTGKKYDIFDLVNRRVDKDHIIPHSERPTDSLDSMVLTFPEVNQMKGRRTAQEFIEKFQGKPVPGNVDLCIRSMETFEQWVSELECHKGYIDDQRRKKRRKEMLLIKNYIPKGQTLKESNQNSQLVRMVVQALQIPYIKMAQRPLITTIPSYIITYVNRHWELMECLSNTCVRPPNGFEPLPTKAEIEEMTYLHYAMNACVLVLIAQFLPNKGRIWNLIKKRPSNLRRDEYDELMASGFFQDSRGQRLELKKLNQNLKDQISQRLAEKRVVQHVSSDMNGMAAEETVWRVFDPCDTHPSAEKIKKWLHNKIVSKELECLPDESSGLVIIVCRKRKSQSAQVSGKTLHETPTWRWIYQEISKSKLVGLSPNKNESDLKKIKAVKILSENFGLALDPIPKIIRFHKVWPQITELSTINNGKRPRILRNGHLIKVTSGKFKGLWKVFSTKNNASGIALDIGYPDVVKLRNKTEGHKINVSLATLMQNGLSKIKAPYTGVAFQSNLI